MLTTISSKDTVIRVWNRETLELHRVLRGHEGPVNAVGLESGRVVRHVPRFFLLCSSSHRSAQAEMAR